MPKPKFIAFIFLLLLLSNRTEGQNIYNNWYFGNNAGITFNTTPPTSLTGGQTNQLEGCASISNNSGTLLFYTDGVKVWDKNHSVMPNGTGLTGNWSSSQSALIVPFPSSNSKYYIFTVTDWMGNGDLRYSIVDMTLNSGNGDIIPASKNILLSTNQTEKLVAANATNCGIWILTHQRNNNRFESYLVTSIGISTPIFSDAGSIHTSIPTPPDNYNNLTGVMKVSKNNLKIGLATLARIIELFDFNPTTGIINNPIALPMIAPNQGYGVCFSPDNSKFYITESNFNLGAGYDIFQFDISSSNPTTIINSKTLVGRALLPIHIVGDLQIGSDNKIYFARLETNYLGVIPNPNLSVPACGLINNGVSLGTGVCQAGLPNEIRLGGGSIQVNLGNDTTLCPGESLILNAPNASTYLWSTGATTQTITVSTNGQYWVSVSNGACFSSDTINVTFSLPTINFGNDTTLCTGQSLLLNGGVANTHLWSTGATSQTINVTSAGQYWVKASNGNCFKADTINIVFSSPPNVNLGSDTTLCQGQALLLNAGAATTHLWSTGATSQTINVTSAGQYWVKASNGNCFRADTINIAFNSPPNINLGSDTILCQGQSLILNAGAATTHLWSTGATSQTINVTSAGQYWVKASNGNCFKADTINIVFNSPPNVNLGSDTTLCQGQALLLNAGATTTYLWSTGATSQTINVTSAGQYWVKASNSNCFKRDTIGVIYKFPPVLLFPPDTTLCNNQILKLNAGSATKYLWSTGETTQVINVTQSGNYSVNINYYSTCQKQFFITVKFESCDCLLFMPNAFTPNSDGLNDIFKPAKKSGCQFLLFSIFNRYGEKIYESTDLNKGWDGKFKRLQQDNGVFVWMITAIKDGQPKVFKGTVTLIR